MYSAILCDLDGVLRIWDPEATAAIEREHGLPAGAIHAASFDRALLAQVTNGEVEDAVWRQRVADALARLYPAGVAAATAWSRLTGSLDADMLAVLAEQRGRGLRIGLVTNASTRLEADLAALQIDQRFDAIVSSARLGFGKPERRIFEVAAQRVGCAPSACIFIDDTAGHVDAAVAAGMTGLHYKTPREAREALAALLI